MSECVCTSCQTPFLRTSNKTKKCKTCLNRATRAWHEANREHVNASNKKRYQERRVAYLAAQRGAYIRRQYGISEEEYDSSRAAATSCEICQGPFEKGPELDHCHSSGKLRGWLCGKCNRMLGLVGDSIPVLKEAINYLEKHGRASD